MQSRQNRRSASFGFPPEHTTLAATCPNIDVKLCELDVVARLTEFSLWRGADRLKLQPCRPKETSSSRASMIFVADA